MTEIEEKIQDAEIEISLAIGFLEWAKSMTFNNYCIPFIGEHISGRIDGLDAALNTLKELEKIALEEQADVHEPEKD